MNEFTLKIKLKGWTVDEACEHWGYHYDTYKRYKNNFRYHNRLRCLINGLEDKNEETA